MTGPRRIPCSPSRAEKIEYSVVVMPDTVCVSRTLPGLPPSLGSVLRALVREREGRFANQREFDLGLVTYLKSG